MFAEVGIPAIKCGPAPEAADAKPATSEMQKVEDLEAAARMYAFAALEIANGTGREEVVVALGSLA